jgi:hypothetical protein
MAGSKWRIGIVFHIQLDSLSDRLSCDLGYNAKAKIDPRCDAARGDEVSVLDDTATPRMKAPVQTEVTYLAVHDCLRTNSIVSRSAIA